MSLLWLTAYPLKGFEKSLVLARPLREMHSCSWVVNLLPEIRKKYSGEIHLITVSTDIKMDQYIYHENIHYHILKKGLPLINRSFPSWFPLDVFFGFFLLRKKVCKKINKIHPKIIHAYGTESIYGISAVSQNKFLALISIQGVITELVKISPSLRFKLISFWERYTIKRNKNFECRTHFDSSFVKKVNPSAKTYFLNRAINKKFFVKREYSTNHKILFVGSLLPWKGVDFLINSFKLVLKKIPTSSLIIIGDGPQKNLLENLSKKLGISNKISFLGIKSSDEISNFHQSCQLFVLPSRNDNSPNALAEAMASGMPVIATDVGGVSSMFENENSGILVPSENKYILSEKIVSLLLDCNECKRLGSNAQLLIKNKSYPEKVADDALKIYNELGS